MHVLEFLKASGPGLERVYSGSWIEKMNGQGYSCCGIDVLKKAHRAGDNGGARGYERVKDFVKNFQNRARADDADFINKLTELGGSPAFGMDLPVLLVNGFR